MSVDVQRLVADVLSSKKYASMDEALVRRVCADLSTRYDKHSDALRATKTALHRMHQAFLRGDGTQRALTLIREHGGHNLSTDRAFARQLLALHASTAERLPTIESACAFLGAFIGFTDRVVDIGSGFAPFALPFYPHLPAAYLACEISAPIVSLLNAYFAALDKPAFTAIPLDAAVTTPPPADVALLLKLLPLLEQQRKGRARDLLKTLPAQRIIVSFPVTTLSGKSKGMETFYSTFLESNLPDHLTITARQRIGNELFYALSAQ